MSFRITGLPAEAFQHLFALSDEELAAHNQCAASSLHTMPVAEIGDHAAGLPLLRLQALFGVAGDVELCLARLRLRELVAEGLPRAQYRSKACAPGWRQSSNLLAGQALKGGFDVVDDSRHAQSSSARR
jgi:hypothetical protein